MQQPVAFDGTLGTESSPYDATKSGPLCPQGHLDSQNLSMTMDKTMDQWAHEIIGVVNHKA